jgi:hypothetical protein
VNTTGDDAMAVRSRVPALAVINSLRLHNDFLVNYGFYTAERRKLHTGYMGHEINKVPALRKKA